jgi:hypothetical protein
MTYSEHNQYVLDQSLKLLKDAVEGLIKDPASLDHWHQANHCLRSIASVHLYMNPNHFGDTHEADSTGKE